MLYLFAGADTKKKLEALERFTVSLRKSAEVFSINKDNFFPDQIESLYSGAGLFGDRCAVLFENILEDEEAGEFLLSRLDAFHDSENHFVFLEGKPLKATLDAFKKARAELNVFELPVLKKEKWNNFTLANALREKNKLSLWISFRQAINHGATLEELAGILFWKAKDMIIKKNFSKFSRQELEGFSSKISYLLPRARREGLDAEAAMEEFLLEAF